ncbi:cytoplasmic protein [Rahnella perminowiae]|uniref:cytoplasmic protein n=1 Tax=Rahnella perminowiae TaxID=2816244 RepID=UPI00300F0815
MKNYRLAITKQGQPIGNLDSCGKTGAELAGLIASLLAGMPDWEFTWWESDSEKRILESSPDGIRILSSEKLYRASARPDAVTEKF